MAWQACGTSIQLMPATFPESFHHFALLQVRCVRCWWRHGLRLHWLATTKCAVYAHCLAPAAILVVGAVGSPQASTCCMPPWCCCCGMPLARGASELVCCMPPCFCCCCCGKPPGICCMPARCCNAVVGSLQAELVTTCRGIFCCCSCCHARARVQLAPRHAGRPA